MESEKYIAEVDAGSVEARKALRWSVRSPGRAALVYACCYLLISGLGGVATNALTHLAPLAAGVVLTALGAAVLALSLLLVLSICRLKLGPGAELVAILSSSIVFTLVRPMVFSFLGRMLGVPELGKQFAASFTLLPMAVQLLLGNTILIVWAAFLGKLISRIIREGKLLLPIAAVAALADIFTVFWGVVAKVTKSAPEVVATFSASTPVAPPPGIPAPILTAVGIGDFLFFALFLALALQYGMRPIHTLWATFVMMLLAPVAFILWPDAPGMPGLPFLATAALWANWPYLAFTKEEKRALAVAGLLVLWAAVSIWALFHR